jgi:formamidopyrimidine-DNA glycosylase
MPELPEVETIKNDLKKAILSKKIASVEVGKKKIVKSSFSESIRTLKGNAFKDIERVGKLMIFHLKSGQYLFIHLKMTGQLIYCATKGCIAGGHEIPGMDDKLPNKYTHATFNFVDLSSLYFNDMRQFGYLKVVDEDELNKIKSEYGVEPLSKNFTLESFKEILSSKKISIKVVLMNQSLISGIGNLYADEILFRAGIRSDRNVNTLNKEEIKKIFGAVKPTLKKAIEHRGTTFSDYVDSKGRKGNFTKFLKVYRREGEKCYKCGGIIKKIKIGGRGTRYCPKCQK